MTTSRITFIGAGNMAQSLIRGLLRHGHPASSIRATDPEPTPRARLAEVGITTSADNNAAIEDADVVVLAVKPQVLGGVLRAMNRLLPDQLLLSIAAGMPLDSLQRWSTRAQPIVRCMPNTPALLGAGITALYANNEVNAHQRSLAEDILKAAGKTLWVEDEGQLDAVTAVSGSGPAYFFYLMEAMIDAGVALGLNRQMASELTLETAYGAALMAREGDDPPATLRANVTSPGGTTAAALSILDARNAASAIRQALEGAAARSEELAEELASS